MDVQELKFLYTEPRTQSNLFFENIESLISVLGDPDCIMVFKYETELSWYKSDPDRILEITVYEDDEIDFWYERCTFGEDGEEDIETGEMGNKLHSLREWLEYGE